MAKPDKTAKDFDPEVLARFDEYVHGVINRREFLKKISHYAIGAVTATSILNSLNPKYAEAQEIDPKNSKIDGQFVNYPSPQNWQGYLVKPKHKKEKLPAVLVIHENRGRNPYIEDVTRHLALSGFLAFSPDALSPMGGWPGSDDEGRTMQRKLDRDEMMSNWLAAIKFLKSHPLANGKVGAVGFCYGGGVVNKLAVQLPGILDAGVPFYGRQPVLDDVKKIKTPLLIQNGGLDKRILAGAPAFEQALKTAGVEFTSYVYKDANHGFHNNTTPRYDEAAAKLAWERTIEFFNKHLP